MAFKNQFCLLQNKSPIKAAINPQQQMSSVIMGVLGNALIFVQRFYLFAVLMFLIWGLRVNDMMSVCNNDRLII